MKLLTVKSRLRVSLLLLCFALLNILGAVLPYSRFKLEVVDELQLYVPLVVSLGLLVLAMWLQRQPSPRETLQELRVILENERKLTKVWGDTKTVVEPFSKMSRLKKISQLTFLFFGVAFFGLALVDLMGWIKPLTMTASDGELVVVPRWVTASLTLCVSIMCLTLMHLQRFRLTDDWQDELRQIAKDVGIKY